MPFIELTKGKFTLVDEDTLQAVKGMKYHYSSHGYAARSVHGKPRRIVYLHREIMDAPEGMEVDHTNGDKLDNRRENLRVIPKYGNLLNKPVRPNTETGYKGVRVKKDPKRIKRFYATITYEGKSYALGHFLTAEEAALAYNKAAVKYHKEFANLNVLKKDL